MKLHIVFIGLLFLAGFSSAQSISEQCAESCCDSYSGNYQYGSCSGLSTSESLEYVECKKSCTDIAGCCGPAFLIFGLLGAVFVVRQ